MATSFDVFYLGIGAPIDPTEGNATSEDASTLLGGPYGSAGAPLHADQRTWAPSGTPGPTYDADNSTFTDQFDVGGTTYTFDAAATYLATLTYADGTTATANLVVAQATTGELFVVPHVSADADQQAILEAKPIQSVTLTSVVSSSADLTGDRLDASYPDATVDGTTGADMLGVGSRDADGDLIDGGDNVIAGGDGNDFLEGGGGADTITGGANDDVIFGDTVGSDGLGYFDPAVTGNVSDSGATETLNTRAVELVTLANGDLILITSERAGADDGIATYRIDNDPNSATYGQTVGGKIDQIETSGSLDGYDAVEDMAATTLASGQTYVFTADTQTIGITQVNLDGTLTQLSSQSLTGSSAVQELSIAEVSGQPFLLALDGNGQDSLIAYTINADGTLSQTDIETDGSGTGETYLNNDGITNASLLESFTNSSGETFVIAGGADDGISLWTLNGSGQLTFQNARGDDQAGSGETDPQLNDLGRDLISPSNTGLNDVDVGSFTEINGQTYLFVGGLDNDVTIFRIDADTGNGDGTHDLTLVGQLDSVVSAISSMAILETDQGPQLVVGGGQSSIEFYDISVGADGTVSIAQTGSIQDSQASSHELADSEDIDVEGGILVSASDADSGVAIIDTGLKGANSAAGNDSIDAGSGDDFVSGGDGADTVLGGTGADTIYGDGDFVRESLNWQDITSAQVVSGFTTNTGNVDVTFSAPTQTGATLSVDNSTTVYTDSIDDGAAEADTNSSFASNLSSSSSQGVYRWVFTDQVLNVSFTVSDLDAPENLQIFAFDADNNPINVLLTPGSDLTVSDSNGDGFDDSIDGGGDGQPLDPAQTVTVTIPGPVSRIQMDHDLDSGGGLGIRISEMFFDVPVESITGDADSLSGGDGADEIYGDGGDDTLDGGAEADLLSGGTGADSITGGTGADTIYGDESAARSIGAELLSNPDFGSNADGWTLINPTGSTPPVYTGSFDAVRLNSADEAAGGDGLAQTVETQPGGTYDISVDLVQNGGASGTHTVVVDVIAEDGTVLDTDTVLVSFGQSATVNLSFTATTDNTTLSITNPSSGATVNTDVLITAASFVQTALPPSTDGNDTIDGGDGDDLIYGGGGDDSITAGSNNDSVEGGEGNDTIDGGIGSDTVLGGAGNDSLTGGGTTGNADTVYGGDGNDTITGGSGIADDSLFGEAGDDLINGNRGADTIDAGTGSDTIQLSDDYGNDDITAGEDGGGTDIDVLDASGITSDGIDIQLTSSEQGTATSGTNVASFREVEQFTLTDQDDSFQSGAQTGNYTIDGGAGDDTIVEGGGTNVISGGDDSDRFEVGYGRSTIVGGEGGTDVDTLSGSVADDTLTVTFQGDGRGIYADDDGDSGEFFEIEAVDGTSGADVVDAAADSTGIDMSGLGGADTLTGGSGADTLDGGAGDDSLTGGAGNDLFIYTTGEDTLNGFNSGNTGAINDGDQTNNDFIDLSSRYDHLFELWADYQDDFKLNQSNSFDTQGNAVDYTDNTQFGVGDGLTFTGASASASPTFFNFDNTGVVCFTPGALIETASGPVPIESLAVGDLVVTRDNGLKPILWIGTKTLNALDLSSAPELRPILLKGGHLGLEKDLIVSPQHGMLVRSPNDSAEEVLVRAKHLVSLKGSQARTMNGRKTVTYIHLLFEDHQLIRADGTWSESLFLGPMAAKSMGTATLEELQRLFPEVISPQDGTFKGPKARTFLKPKELPTEMARLEAT